MGFVDRGRWVKLDRMISSIHPHRLYFLLGLGLRQQGVASRHVFGVGLHLGNLLDEPGVVSLTMVETSSPHHRGPEGCVDDKESDDVEVPAGKNHEAEQSEEQQGK